MAFLRRVIASSSPRDKCRRRLNGEGGESGGILIPEGIGIFDIGCWWVADRLWFGVFCGGGSLAFWVLGGGDLSAFWGFERNWCLVSTF